MSNRHRGRFINRCQAVPSWVLNQGGVATLDMDFVNNRAWANPVLSSIPSLLTCARASTGYYTTAAGTLTSFGNNVLRYGTNGLLVEESRTNLILQSNTFGTTWAASNLTNLTTTTTGPDGVAASGTLLNETVTSGTHGVTQSVTKAASALAYAHSVYAKQGTGRTRLYVQIDDGSGNGAGVTFDLSGAQVGVAAAGVGTAFTTISATIASLANGWCFCTLMATSNTATTIKSSLFVDNGSGTGAANHSYAGTVSDGVFVFGAQLEQAAFPTSYIPTTTGSVTRATDNITLTSITPITGATSTFYAQISTSIIAGATPRILDTQTGAPLFIASSTAISTYNGSVQINATLGSGTVTTVPVKSAAAYDGTGRTVCANAGTVASDSNTMPTPTALTFGSGTSGLGNSLDGYIRRVAYWNSRLSNGALQTLTT